MDTPIENKSDFAQAETPDVLVSDFEKMKLVYEKTAEHHKYYLSWRQFILSGFFAVISVLLLCMYYTYLSPSLFLKCLTPFVALTLVLAVVFFENLENRNKELYQSCQRTATVIEMELFGNQLKWHLLSNKGLFFDLNKSFKLNELMTNVIENKITPEIEVHNFTNKQDFSKSTHSRLLDYFFFTIKLFGIILTCSLAYIIWYKNRTSIVNYFTLKEWIGFALTIIIPSIILIIKYWKLLFCKQKNTININK